MKRKMWVVICSISMLPFSLLGCAIHPENSPVVGSVVGMEQMQRAKEQADAERAQFRLAINQVLAMDDQTQTGGVDSAVVVERMKVIDTSACPNDFRAAYLTHLHAWESLADAKQKRVEFNHYVNSGEALPEELVRILLGDPTGKVNEMIRADKIIDERIESARSDVHTTFDRVTEVAMNYGATAPATTN